MRVSMPLGTLGDGRRPHAVHECLPGYHINFSEKRNAKIKRQPRLDTITCFLRISDSTTTPIVTCQWCWWEKRIVEEQTLVRQWEGCFNKIWQGFYYLEYFFRWRHQRQLQKSYFDFDCFRFINRRSLPSKFEERPLLTKNISIPLKSFFILWHAGLIKVLTSIGNLW